MNPHRAQMSFPRTLAREYVQRQSDGVAEMRLQNNVNNQLSARRPATADSIAQGHLRHSPHVIPWRPSTGCVVSLSYGCGYGYEERAKIVCKLLCTYVLSLRKNLPDPKFGKCVRQISAASYQTNPTSPNAISMTVDGAVVYIRGRPHIWIIAEAADYDEGMNYFICWRNRQTMFPILKADGTMTPALTWKEISDKLLFDPLHSRCHASPCELSWGPQELQNARAVIQNEEQQ